ncbi:MAG: hypothetical protein PVI86_16750, partial [Phycisphaerae bacterium]
DPIESAMRMEVRRTSDHTLCHRYRHARPGRIRPYAWLRNHWTPRRVTPPINMSFVGLRTWTWPLVLILTAYPLITFVHQRFFYYVRKARHKRTLCPGCGYNRTGLEGDRCPECGAMRLCLNCGHELADLTGPKCPQCARTIPPDNIPLGGSPV